MVDSDHISIYQSTNSTNATPLLALHSIPEAVDVTFLVLLTLDPPLTNRLLPHTPISNLFHSTLNFLNTLSSHHRMPHKVAKRESKQETTPRGFLTHIGNWTLGRTLGRGAYGSPDLSFTHLCRVSADTTNSSCKTGDTRIWPKGSLQNLTSPSSESNHASYMGSNGRRGRGSQGGGASQSAIGSQIHRGGRA